MNYALARIHHVLFLGYPIGFALIALAIGSASENNKVVSILGSFLVGTPLILVHYYGAVGARKGKRWGRNLSRVVGVLFLLGFPLGTLLGIYILSRTGKKWESAPTKS